jgi:hypothetical protein
MHGQREVYGKWACECPKGTKVNPNWPVKGKSTDDSYRDRTTGKWLRNPHRLCIPEDQDVTLTPIGGAAPVIPDANLVVQPVETPVPVQAVVIQQPNQAPQLVKPSSKLISGYRMYEESDMPYGGACGPAYGTTKEEGKAACDSNPNCLAFTVRKNMANCVKNAKSRPRTATGGHTLYVKQ